MIGLERFCEPDETIAGLEYSSLGCDVYMVAKPDRGDHDRVLLDIRTETTPPCLLIGGNPFKIETLHGFGRMTLLDVASGKHRNIFLERGVNIDVPIGVAYSYANCGEEGSQLVLRDTAKDFDLADEVTAENMAAVISGLLLAPN